MSAYYLHYKNKPYKFHGIAKHSETLEELVVYETLYPNPTARLWVRPKEMFFSQVKVDGVEVPRFRQVVPRLHLREKVSTVELDILAGLIKASFGDWDETWFFSHFHSHKNFRLVLAEVDGEWVGFKLGYELEQTVFYSWLGGVIPRLRRLGIAQELMRAQHEWCSNLGYKKIVTKTQNRFREMLLLNIKSGFNVIGTQQSEEGGMKILLEKWL